MNLLFRLKVYLISILFLFFFGCTEKEYIDIDVSPQLEILVKDKAGNPILGATVSLYTSENDFNSKVSERKTEMTNAVGKVLFKDLNETVYYFYAEKDGLNNFYEAVTFTNPLSKNEIRTITCIIR